VDLVMDVVARTEATPHRKKGMMRMEKRPEGRGRDLTDLGLRTVLGPAVVAQHGWAQGEVSRILEPAWLLAERLGHRPAYAPVLHSLGVPYLCVDQLAVSLQTADEVCGAG